VNTSIGIEIRGLHKTFRDNHVLRGLDLDVPAGKTVVIMGPSGCGKSVLLKHLVGLIKPDSGQILVGGQDTVPLKGEALEAATRKFAMVFQSAALLNSLTVGENVGLALKEQRKFSQSEIDQVVAERLEMVGLGGKQRLMPAELSGGMKKRVAVARALAMNPQIILYDEPTTGLDPFMSDNVDELIREMKERLGITSIVVTHDLVSSFHVADHVAMFSEGKIVEVGTPSEIQSSSIPYVKRFLSSHRL